MQIPHRTHPIAPAWAYALLASAAVLALSGCRSTPITENVPPPQIADFLAPIAVGDNPENSLDWPGTYQAVLPCNQCPGTAISVQLRRDYTAVVRERRLGGNNDAAATPTTYSGAFRFDPPGGSLIALSPQPADSAAYRFFVSEGWIELRERASGAALGQSQSYRLRKTSEPPQ